jgi:DNA-binding NarL/FixJ family response regulator
MLAINKSNFPKLEADCRHPARSPREDRSPTKVLVADSHFLIREALRATLNELGRDVAILEASDARQTFHIVSELGNIGLILLELDLPDQDGLSVLNELRKRHSATKVVIVSSRHDRDSMADALALGAAGFLPKTAPREIILSALKLVLAGGVYIPPEMLSRGKAPLTRTDGRCSTNGMQPITLSELGLSERQRDVLRQMMEGKSNKAICRALNLAVPTVKNHVTAIFRILKVSSRTEAVVAAHNLGWR